MAARTLSALTIVAGLAAATGALPQFVDAARETGLYWLLLNHRPPPVGAR